MRPAALIAFLGLSRGLGALVNIVHDCDEVFNYWEPLHYLVHGTGMQTWEYRCGKTVIPSSSGRNRFLSCAEYCLWSACVQQQSDLSALQLQVCAAAMAVHLSTLASDEGIQYGDRGCHSRFICLFWNTCCSLPGVSSRGGALDQVRCTPAAHSVLAMTGHRIVWTQLPSIHTVGMIHSGRCAGQCMQPAARSHPPT